MKFNKNIFIITGFYIFLINSISAQIRFIKPEKIRYDEYIGIVPIDDDLDIYLNNPCYFNCGEDIADFSFNWSNSFDTAVNNEILLKRARDKARRDWFNKQKNLIKENIEKKLGKAYSDYNQAKDALFLFSEQENIRINSITPKSKYGNLKTKGFAIQNNHLKDLKYLQLRKLEINANNINNSAYKYIKVDGIALKDIKTLNALNSKWNTLYQDFAENYGRTYYYKNVYKTLQQINFEGKLKNLVVNLKNSYYNSFDEWEQLNYMQFLMNYEELKKLTTPPNYYPNLLNLFNKFKDTDKATSPIIENYAQQNSGTRSDFFTKSCTIRIRAGRDYITKVIPECRKAQTDALNNLLNNVNVDDLILENAQNELDELTKNIPWKASTGTIANSTYTHYHFDGSRGYYKLEDGSIIVASSSEQVLTKTGDLRDKYNEFNPNDKYYYIKVEGTNQWAEMLFNPDNLSDGLTNLFKLAGKELGKSLGRYVLPIEDIKILIDGKDFDRQQVARWKAAGFLILAVIPGSKAIKVVGNIADATVFATKVGSKTVVVKGIQGLRSFTSTNFRHNLSKITKKLPSNSQAHHVLPQKFRSLFEKAGVNIDNPIFGAWWEKTDHLNNAWKYNNEWSNFFSVNPNPSQEAIFNFAKDLMKKYGIPINF